MGTLGRVDRGLGSLDSEDTLVCLHWSILNPGRVDSVSACPSVLHILHLLLSSPIYLTNGRASPQPHSGF